MKISAAGIRRLFVRLHGQLAFDEIAHAFAEAGGDGSRVCLSSLPAWQQFAASMTVLPPREMVSQAFLWCTRHQQTLLEISRPAIPKSLTKIRDRDFVEVLLAVHPHFLGRTELCLRCQACFDFAEQQAQKYLSDACIRIAEQK